MAFDRFLQANVALFLMTHSLAPYFLSGFSAHCAHIIFLFDAIIQLAVLETGFLLFIRKRNFNGKFG